MAAVEVELPHILPHRVPPDAPARPVADMVIDLAVVNQRSPPLVEVAPGPTTILPAYQISGRDSPAMVFVSAEQTGSSDRSFGDLLLWSPGSAPVVMGAVSRNGPASRSYTDSAAALQLTLSGGTGAVDYFVRVVRMTLKANASE